MSSVYQIITDRIIHQLEQGVVPWHKPWKEAGTSNLPKNLISRRPYRGINLWTLMSSEYNSPWWLTYKQARDLGGSVRAGEHGTPVVYWRVGTREVEDGEEMSEKSYLICRYYVVFNLRQCDGIPEPEPPVQPVSAIEPIAACDELVASWSQRPRIEHGGDRASYSKSLDRVRMPFSWQFESAEEYHSTLFHELVHSTGHPARLNRASLMETEYFGDSNYSREELVAELGAAFLCGFVGIQNKTINSSASYLQSWLDILRGDSRLVVVAAGQAQKAVDLITGQVDQEAPLEK